MSCVPVRVVVNRAVLALLVAAAVACEAEPEGGAPFEVEGEPVATNTVDMPRSYRFEPAVIEIDAGTTVTWTNSDQFPHTVHLLDDSEVDENVPVGESIDIPFEQPGTVYYECSLHPQEMQGKIIVR